MSLDQGLSLEQELSFYCLLELGILKMSLDQGLYLDLG